MTNNNLKSNPALSFLKTVAFSSFIGLGVMLAIAVVLALAISKIKHYEMLYTAFSIVLHCIPGFVSTKITAKKYAHSLFFIAIAQGITISLMLIAVSFAWLGSNLNLNLFLTSLIYIFASSILAVLLPTGTRKKIKRT